MKAYLPRGSPRTRRLLLTVRAVVWALRLVMSRLGWTVRIAWARVLLLALGRGLCLTFFWGDSVGGEGGGDEVLSRWVRWVRWRLQKVKGDAVESMDASKL